MMRFLALVSVTSLLITASGCARTVPQPLVAVQTASRPAEARLLDRFEAELAVDPRSGLACLSITAKGLVTKFEDADFTVVQALAADGEEELARFNSPLFLGEDGFLYLREQEKGRPTAQFYRAGAYDAPARGQRRVDFKLSRGLELEARNRSLLPVHGGGPYIAIVAAELPMPAPQAPHLVRRDRP